MTNHNQQPTSGITIEIGMLALHGFERSQRHAIGAALERELARLIGERGWHDGMTSAVQVDGGMFEIGTGARPEQIGAQIAQAVYASCGGNE